MTAEECIDNIYHEAYISNEYNIEKKKSILRKHLIEFAKFHVLKIKHLQQNKYYSGETGYIKSEEWKDIINNIK